MILTVLALKNIYVRYEKVLVCIDTNVVYRIDTTFREIPRNISVKTRLPNLKVPYQNTLLH